MRMATYTTIIAKCVATPQVGGLIAIRRFLCGIALPTRFTGELFCCIRIDERPAWQRHENPKHLSLSNGTPRPSTQTWRLLESKIAGQLCASGWFERWRRGSVHLVQLRILACGKGRPD